MTEAHGRRLDEAVGIAHDRSRCLLHQVQIANTQVANVDEFGKEIYSDMYSACKLFHSNGLFVRLHHAVFQIATSVSGCKILPAATSRPQTREERAYAAEVLDFFLRTYKSLRGRIREQGREAIPLVHFGVEADDDHDSLTTTIVEHLRNFKASLIDGSLNPENVDEFCKPFCRPRSLLRSLIFDVVTFMHLFTGALWSNAAWSHHCGGSRCCRGGRGETARRMATALLAVVFRFSPGLPCLSRWTSCQPVLNFFAIGSWVHGVLANAAVIAVKSFTTTKGEVGFDVDQQLEYSAVLGARSARLLRFVGNQSKSKLVGMLALISESISFITSHLLAASTEHPHPRSTRLVCDLTILACSPAVAGLQHLSGLLAGVSSRCILIWASRYASFREWCARSEDMKRYRRLLIAACIWTRHRLVERVCVFPWLLASLSDDRLSHELKLELCARFMSTPLCCMRIGAARFLRAKFNSAADMLTPAWRLAWKALAHLIKCVINDVEVRHARNRREASAQTSWAVFTAHYCNREAIALKQAREHWIVKSNEAAMASAEAPRRANTLTRIPTPEMRFAKQLHAEEKSLGRSHKICSTDWKSLVSDRWSGLTPDMRAWYCRQTQADRDVKAARRGAAVPLGNISCVAQRKARLDFPTCIVDVMSAPTVGSAAESRPNLGQFRRRVESKPVSAEKYDFMVRRPGVTESGLVQFFDDTAYKSAQPQREWERFPARVDYGQQCGAMCEQEVTTELALYHVFISACEELVRRTGMRHDRVAQADAMYIVKAFNSEDESATQVVWLGGALGRSAHHRPVYKFLPLEPTGSDSISEALADGRPVEVRFVRDAFCAATSYL